MDLGLNGKVAIVTGGARGMGASIVEGFIKEGANVVIADLDFNSSPELEEEAKRNGTKILFVKTDVTVKSDIDKLMSATLDGFDTIDILVNNAGIITDCKFVDLEEEEWDRVNDVNTKGTYLATRAVTPHMIANRQGKIVNISSIVGKKASLNVAHYCASKFAVIGLTQSVAKELGEYGINVNAVCPGFVRTAMWESLLDVRSKSQNLPREKVWEAAVDQIPLKRPQLPEDIANVVLFLSSEIARNITGESISVNGGLHMD